MRVRKEQGTMAVCNKGLRKIASAEAGVKMSFRQQELDEDRMRNLKQRLVSELCQLKLFIGIPVQVKNEGDGEPSTLIIRWSFTEPLICVRHIWNEALGPGDQEEYSSSLGVEEEADK